MDIFFRVKGKKFDKKNAKIYKFSLNDKHKKCLNYEL